MQEQPPQQASGSGRPGSHPARAWKTCSAVLLASALFGGGLLLGSRTRGALAAGSGNAAEGAPASAAGTAAVAALAGKPSQPAAATCRKRRVRRLRWIEETDRQARRVYRRLGQGKETVPDIFKTMSLRPELMEKMVDVSDTGHFADGYLDRRTKEQIATFVSGLNRSHYCVGSHAAGLHDLGARSGEIEALSRADLAAAALPEKKQALLEFVRRLTLKPDDVTEQDITRLRGKGWRDEEIFEAAFDTSLFAFFNRMAAAYGLDYPADGWEPAAHAANAAAQVRK